jgi:hypothetical protein
MTKDEQFVRNIYPNIVIIKWGSTYIDVRESYAGKLITIMSRDPGKNKRWTAIKNTIKNSMLRKLES